MKPGVENDSQHIWLKIPLKEKQRGEVPIETEISMRNVEDCFLCFTKKGKVLHLSDKNVQFWLCACGKIWKYLKQLISDRNKIRFPVNSQEIQALELCSIQ